MKKKDLCSACFRGVRNLLLFMEEGELFYQLIDPFVRFYIGFIKNKKFDSWNEYINTPGYNAWRGNAFEMKFTNEEYSLDEAEYQKIENRLSMF